MFSFLGLVDLSRTLSFLFSIASGAEEKYKENKGVHEMFSVFFLQITGKHGIRSSLIGIQKRETVKESGKKNQKSNIKKVQTQEKGINQRL